VRSRRVAAWLLAIPLMIAGSQVAHVFAYRLVYPQAQVRLQELLATGHGYFAYIPMLAGIGLAFEIVVFFSLVAGSMRRQRHARVSPWAFACLPVLGFAAQEFLERWLAGIPFPWWVVLQPTFRIGLLLQLPFAVLVYVAARLLLRVADHIGSVLRGTGDRASLVGPARGWFAVDVSAPRIAALASGHAGRGPPPRSAATSCPFRLRTA
jgi:hypothetical protein